MTMVMTVVIHRPRKRLSNRARPRGELRDRIVEAALELFHEASFDAVSVEQIVARAKVAKGTFFNFFPRKVDVLLVYFAQLDRRLAALHAKLDPRQPLVALERFVVRAEAMLRTEGALLETLARAIWIDSALLEADRASALQDRRAFAEFFRAAQKARTIHSTVDAEVAAEVLGDLWTGSILLWLAFGRNYNLARTLRPKVRLLFQGLRIR